MRWSYLFSLAIVAACSSAGTGEDPEFFRTAHDLGGTKTPICRAPVHRARALAMWAARVEAVRVAPAWAEHNPARAALSAPEDRAGQGAAEQGGEVARPEPAVQVLGAAVLEGQRGPAEPEPAGRDRPAQAEPAVPAVLREPVEAAARPAPGP